MLRRLFDNCGAKLDNGKARADKKVPALSYNSQSTWRWWVFTTNKATRSKVGGLNICNYMHALYGVLEVKDIFEIEATKLVIIFFIFMNKWRALLVFGVWLAAG